MAPDRPCSGLDCAFCPLDAGAPWRLDGDRPKGGAERPSGSHDGSHPERLTMKVIVDLCVVPSAWAHHFVSPAAAAAGQVFAMGDQPLVQLAGEHPDSVHPGVMPEPARQV